MKPSLLFGLSLSLFHLVTAQNSITSQPSATITSSVSLTPQMSASSISSFYSALATSAPQQPGSGPLPGDAGSAAGSSSAGSDEGASGPESGAITISRGGIIALIVVAVVICIGGAISGFLFYMAKKRSWKIRESIRKSARRVATALTPRRSTFPKDVQKKRRSMRGLTKIEEIPNTPRTRSEDVEKGNLKMSSFELSEPPKSKKWSGNGR